MKCKLTPGLSSGDWNEFCNRFHFPPDDLPHIQAIYTALLPLVESYAYYSLAQDLDGVSLPHYAYRSESTRLNSSHKTESRMPSSA